MKQHVTVVPVDRLIIVDGVPLQFDFPVPDALHALQWHEGAGHTEWTDGPNQPLVLADYASEVAPYVAHWEREKARLAAEAVAAEEARLAAYNGMVGEGVHIERIRRITGYLVGDVNRFNDAKRAEVKDRVKHMKLSMEHNNDCS